MAKNGLSKIFIALACLLLNWAHATPPKPCLQDAPRRKLRAAELQKIVQADQEDRQHWQNFDPSPWAEVAQRDLLRRQRVGEIFGEGCFSTAPDYASAALVFQHGETPDHFYQVFIWSKRGVELGDSTQKQMMALGLDRYLVSLGKKQLFGSQAFQLSQNQCFCLQQVEESFSEARRKEYTLTLSERLEWVAQLNKDKECGPPSQCLEDLDPTPPGSVPGFW